MKNNVGKLDKRINKLKKKVAIYEKFFGKQCEKHETMFMLTLTIAGASMIYSIGMWSVGLIPSIISGLVTAGLYTLAGFHNKLKEDYLTSVLELRELTDEKVVSVNEIKEYREELDNTVKYQAELLNTENQDKTEIKRVRLIRKLLETKYKAANFRLGCMIEDGIASDMAKKQQEFDDEVNKSASTM